MKRVIIVGGGIAGLSAAWFLRTRARVTLLEERPSPGGVVATERAGGFLVEGGPDAFEAGRPEMADLCRELGLEPVPARASRRTILDRGRPRKLSFGDGLLSWRGRLRAAMDLVLPRGPSAGDESAGAFVRRRLGAEALERVFEPVLSGVYLAGADELSLRAAWPALLDLEREHRSVILGWWRARAGGPFGERHTLREGMSRLVERLRETLPGVDVRTRTPARRVDPGWRVHAEGGPLEAEAVILAVPAARAAELVGASFPGLASSLRRFRTDSCATVSLGFRGRPPFDATSLFAAPSEGRRLAAVTVSSEKFEGRAPGGHWLARVLLRGAPSDAARVALEDLRGIFGAIEDPVLERTALWPDARPVYEVGHEARMGEIERGAPAGLHFAGSAYRGLSLPDCIGDARRAADRVLGGS
jgi:oxygen-dependent protoporphyrinogen oxidase